MGKIAPSKLNSTLVRKPKSVRHGGFGKPSPKVSLKRLIMLQRRINTLISDKVSWEENNRNLLDSFAAEKMRCASFRKDSFHWQRLYHESMVTVNTYKVKQTEMVQVLTACLREIDSIYPHMVALSDCVTTNKIRISNLLGSLPSEYDCLPRQFQEIGKGNDANQKSGKPTRHRVGPMVKGMPITKPKILLERVMLPQPQEPENEDLSPVEENNPLTPIAEENEIEEENVRMAHVSMRPKRRLGTSWRLRRQEKLDKDRERDRVNKSPPAMAYDGDSSDTESNPSARNHMEPVVRFKDVSRLLQNSSLIKVDTARTGDVESSESSSSGQSKTETQHKAANSKSRVVEDPLEGSSWMFTNNHSHRPTFRSNFVPERRSSLYNSDSSDEDENTILSQINISNSSTMNTLVNKNQIFTIPEPNVKGRISLSLENSNDVATSSPIAEPDSTNIIDSDLINTFSSKNSSGSLFRGSGSSSESISNLQISSKNTSLENNSLIKVQSSQKISIKTNSPTVRLSKVSNEKLFASLSNNSSLISNKRRSSSCGNCQEKNSLDVREKRIRKPKSHLYPGEEDDSPVAETKSSKLKKSLSSSRKSVLGNSNNSPVSKTKSSKQKRLSNGKKSLSEKSDNSPESKTKKSKPKTLPTARKSVVGKPKPKLSITKRRSSATPSNSNIEDKSSGSSSKTVKNKSRNRDEDSTGKKLVPKKSSMKKSLYTPRTTSSTDGLKNSIDNGDAARPRRKKTSICYRESPMNVKLRRP